MPNVTIAFRARNIYVDVTKSGQVWGCRFHGRCRGPLSTANRLSGACATVTLHEWPQAELREEVPAWISEESLGWLHLSMYDRETGEHSFSAGLRVPPDVYRKALEVDLSQDVLLIYVESGDLSPALGGESAAIERVRLNFHTRNDPEHGTHGPIESADEDD